MIILGSLVNLSNLTVRMNVEQGIIHQILVRMEKVEQTDDQEISSTRTLMF